MEHLIFVLNARALDFKGTDDKPVKGTKVHYQVLDLDAEKGMIGRGIADDFIRDGQARDIPSTGIYKGLFTAKMKDGEIKLQLVAVDLVQAVDFDAMAAAARQPKREAVRA